MDKSWPDLDPPALKTLIIQNASSPKYGPRRIPPTSFQYEMESHTMEEETLAYYAEDTRLWGYNYIVPLGRQTAQDETELYPNSTDTDGDRTAPIDEEDMMAEDMPDLDDDIEDAGTMTGDTEEADTE